MCSKTFFQNIFQSEKIRCLFRIAFVYVFFLQKRKSGTVLQQTNHFFFFGIAFVLKCVGLLVYDSLRTQAWQSSSRNSRNWCPSVAVPCVEHVDRRTDCFNCVCISQQSARSCAECMLKYVYMHVPMVLDTTSSNQWFILVVNVARFRVL